MVGVGGVMVIKSITQRWFLNSLSVIFIVVVLISIIVAIFMKNLYYTGAEQVITSRANSVSSILLRMLDDDTLNFNTEIRNIVENSEDKDFMEITAIDHNGEIALSSSGFSYTNTEIMPDYEMAATSLNGLGNYIGTNSLGEKIMAVTLMLPYINADYSAIRYVVSLEGIDSVLFYYIVLSIIVGVGILGFVVISGFYFIKSIVIPIREIGVAARKFATGDLTTRIEKKSNDELGELCDIINFMADELQSAESMKNEFISSVSHELRTPLTAIKGWGETLMAFSETEDDTMKKGVRVITSETERLSLMVEELLDFSKIQSGKMQLVSANIDILAELEDVLIMYEERAKRDGIDLIYNDSGIMPFFFGDRNRLRQVFINVVDNGLKYSDTGDSVTVTANETDEHISISVADTGVGIAESDLPKLKTKFFKANTSRRGSGIGLAVANEIITMHGGEILIDSVLNEGTTVTIQLPKSSQT